MPFVLAVAPGFGSEVIKSESIDCTTVVCSFRPVHSGVGMLASVQSEVP